MALRESWTNIHLHICLFHSWQIFTYLPLYDNKYFCVCSLLQICLYNTYLFIFDEEVILSPTPVYYLPDPSFLEGGYVIQREWYEMIITWWNDILISNIHNHHHDHDHHHSSIADRALSRWGGGQEGWSDSNCRRDAAGCTHDADGDIYIMMKCLSVCLSVTKNDHFLLGVSCNHLNPP